MVHTNAPLTNCSLQKCDIKVKMAKAEQCSTERGSDEAALKVALPTHYEICSFQPMTRLYAPRACRGGHFANAAITSKTTTNTASQAAAVSFH